MGKNYRKELDILPEIYNQARLCNCETISRFLDKYSSKTFLAIGSGGSYSVAKIFEYMCTVSGKTCKSITPLELGYYSNQLRQNVAALFTAGGGNNDCKNAYKFVSEHEMEGILTCCMRKNSPIKKLQRDNLHNYFFEYQMPVNKDGYLAVESLISSLTILAKAFEITTNDSFFKTTKETDWLSGEMNLDILDKILSRESIIVLHGGITTPAAVDLESKFSETSLGNIQLVDFRNFAHGRHYWLSDRAKSTGILALVSSQEKKLATQTLQIVPQEIPVLRLDIDDTTIMGLFKAFHYVFEIVYQAGSIRGVDPGKPKVPEFGKKMYHINYNLGREKRSDMLCAAERKMVAGMNDCLDECICQGEISYKKIKSHKFRGIVFDYDGTLHNKENYTSTEREIYIKINEFLEKGIIIGIATGRGKSVRKELQEVIKEAYWGKVVIAYYNGGCLGTLDDNSIPNKKEKEFPKAFKDIEDYMNKNISEGIITVDGMDERNPYQLTIIKEHKRNNCSETIKEFIQEIPTLKVLESSHSIDIIPKTSSKNNIFNWIGWKAYVGDDFLRIGDAGNLGGNDYELLQSIYGVSVDYVSSSSRFCWNYAKPGMRNLEATLYYLTDKLTLEENEIRWG
mgnify:FL=1